MTLDRATLQSLLPCYVCGDLAPEVADAVRAAVAQDAELAAQVGWLRGSREACLEALTQRAPDVGLAVEPEPAAPAPTTVPSRLSLRPGGLLMGIAAAVLLAVGAVWLSPGDPVEVDLLAVADTVSAQPAGFIAESDPVALTAALRAQGVIPNLAGVGDLGFLGMRLVGGMPAPGDLHGAVIVYDRDGALFVCQMYADVGIPGQPVRTLRAAGVELRAFHKGDESIVAWQAPGMTCLFSGPLPTEELLALVADRVRGPTG